jgi:sporulation protein YlmC with PRC-barrel domain
MLPYRPRPDDGASTTLAGVGSHPGREDHPHRMTLADPQAARIEPIQAMPAMRIDLDMAVSCVDGAVGELTDVVIDPGTRCLTHLVVRPRDRQEDARLMPIERAGACDGSEGISLECTVAEMSEAEAIQGSAYIRPGELPVVGADWDVGIQEMYPLPEYGSVGPEILGAGMAMEYDQHVGVSYHRVPKGDVEIRRTSPVTTADGHHLGHVIGFVIDDDERITELVLEHGHLWGKRTITLPSSAIDRFETDELVLSLTSDEVGALTRSR